jgi:hypothetical protein
LNQGLSASAAVRNETCAQTAAFGDSRVAHDVAATKKKPDISRALKFFQRFGRLGRRTATLGMFFKKETPSGKI